MRGMTPSRLSRKKKCLSIRRNACGSGKGRSFSSLSKTAVIDRRYKEACKAQRPSGNLVALRFLALVCLTGKSSWKGLVMTAALLYQPRQRWRVGVAFGAAALIHCAAIAIANAHRDPKVEEPSGYNFPEVTYDPIPQVDEQPADLNDVAPTPATTNESLFPEEGLTPPPVRRQTIKSITRIARPTHGTPGSLNTSSARVL